MAFNHYTNQFMNEAEDAAFTKAATTVGPATNAGIASLGAVDQATPAAMGLQPPSIPTNFSGNAYFAANPDVAAAYQAAPGGLNTDDFAKLHYNTYGANEQRLADPNAIYNKLVQDSYGTIGRTGVGADASNIDQAGLDYWKGQLASGAIAPQDFGSVFNNAVNVYKEQNPDDKYTQYVNNYQKTQTENNQIRDYVSSVLSDTALSPSDQANKILNQARQGGFDQQRLESVFGKDKVQPYMDMYKTNINDFINTTLAKEPGTTMNEVGILHKAAVDNKWTPDELVKYGGLDKATAQSYFDMYDKGIGSIVTSLNDPKTDDTTKTATLLSLAQKYGTTDADLAKASKGKYTEKEIAAYLDPVRDVPTGLQKLMNDPKATASDITKFINNAKADPRAAGIFGVGLDKVLAASPELVMRDIQNGTGNTAENYKNFLAQAKATPESAAKYAPQIASIEKVQSLISRAVNKDYGGKEYPWMYEMFTGLNAKDTAQAPTQLEFTPAKTDVAQGVDGDGNLYSYTRTLTPAQPKEKGLRVVETDDNGNPTKYIKEIDSASFNNKPGERTHTGSQGLVAEYDDKGKLTGYSSGNRIYTSNPTWIGAKWDADGKSAAYGGRTGGSGFKGFAQDVLGAFNDMGIVGQLALMYATGGAGSALASQMGGTALAQAAASGLISGALSEVGGGDFGKGFLGGAAGSGVGSLVQGAMPTGGFTPTGNLTVDSYLTKALPNAASSAARTGVLGGNALDAGLYSLLNTGVGMGVNAGTNMLLGETGLDKLGAAQPYATGIASNLLSGAITGRDFDINKAITNTAAQQLLQTGKTAARP
jgi:hypothetical protein